MSAEKASLKGLNPNVYADFAARLKSLLKNLLGRGIIAIAASAVAKATMIQVGLCGPAEELDEKA